MNNTTKRLFFLFFSYCTAGLINVDTSVLPSTVNAQSQFSFVIYPSTRVTSTDTITIVFPIQIQLNTGSRICQATSASDSSLTINTCSSNLNKLTATVTSTQPTVTDFVIKLVVLDGIINPPSTYADTFDFKITTSDNVVKDENNIMTTTFTPGTLQNVQVSSSSSQSGEISNLSFGFTPGHSILMGGGTTSISLIPGTPATTLMVNTPGYYIKTLDAAGNLIEISNSLSLKVTNPSAISTFTISSTNTQINQMTSLSFVFKTPQFKPQDSILELIFPNNIPISQLTLNSIQGISKITPVVNFTISGQTIRMENAISTYYIGSDIHFFRVSMVQNQGSTRPSGNFGFNIYTKNNYIMYSLQLPVTYSATPGQFSNILITQSNKEINAVNSYTFSFINNDLILAGSTLLVTFPPELSVGNFSVTNCNKIIKGLNTNSKCTVTTNRLLTITNGFGGNLDSLSEISFTLDNITNYSCVKQTTTFKIEAYTSENYAIDVSDKLIFVDFIEGDLQNTELTSGSKANFETTPYTFDFDLKNGLPFDSQIIIEFPTDVQITNIYANNKIYCNVTNYSTGSSYFSTCNVTVSSQKQSVLITNFNPNFVVSAGSEMTIIVPDVINPRSLKPSGLFNIKTQTSAGCGIDKEFSSISLTNTTAGTIAKITVTPLNRTNGAITDYTFELTPGKKIVTQDVLEIIFPKQLALPAGGNSLIINGVVNMSANLANNVTINTDGLSVVRITISLLPSTCDCVQNGDKISFVIKNIRNPQSLKPTETFDFKFITSDLFLIENYPFNFSIMTTTPNELTQVNAKPDNLQINTVSDYTVSFVTFNPIPVEGIIKIVYPSEITIEDGMCIAKQNIDTNLICTNYRGDRMIVVSGGFPNATTGLIEFVMKGIRNEVANGFSYTGSFQVYTETKDNFVIDRKITGLNIFFLCEYPCSTCLSDKTTCLTCIRQSPVPYLLNGECVSACQSGYYANANYTCVKCQDTCATCNNTFQCLTCAPSFPYMLPITKTCVATCQEGNYVTTDNYCTPCNSPCQTCRDKPDKCTSCQTNSGLSLLYQNTCISVCFSNAILINGVCEMCHPECKTCEGAVNKCTSCVNTPNAPKVLLNNRCVDPSECRPSDNNYADIPYGICLKCDDKCEICGNSPTKCEKCKEGFVLDRLNGVCLSPVNSCQEGFYLNEDEVCSKCDQSCSNCISRPGFCLTCGEGLFFQMNQCVDQCKEGFFFVLDSTEGRYKCDSCSSNCRTCKGDRSTCYTCQDNFFLHENRCVGINSCPEGFYADPISKTCVGCKIKNCSKCDKTKCLQCSNGTYLYDDICSDKCPAGFIEDILSNVCLQKIFSSLPNPIYTGSKVKYPPFYFGFFIFVIFIICLNIYVKNNIEEILFFGTCVGFVSIINIIHLTAFVFFAYASGVDFYFITISAALCLNVIFNCTYMIIYEFYTSKDTEFDYWKKERCFVSNVYFLAGLLLDFKIIRLLYSRYFQLDSFSVKFKNYKLIHSPFRLVAILQIFLQFLPLVGFSVFIIFSSLNYTKLFWMAVENISLTFILTLLIVLDFVKNKDINNDFYNQKRNKPDIIPYDMVYDKSSNYQIQKRFDFNDVTKSRTTTSRMLVNSSISSRRTSDIPQRVKRRNSTDSADNVGNATKSENNTVITTSFRDDTHVNLNQVRRRLFPGANENTIDISDEIPIELKMQSPQSKKKGILEHLSFGIKHVIDKISAKKSSYSKLENAPQTEVEIKAFSPHLEQDSTPNFDKNKR